MIDVPRTTAFDDNYDLYIPSGKLVGRTPPTRWRRLWAFVRGKRALDQIATFDFGAMVWSIEYPEEPRRKKPDTSE